MIELLCLNYLVFLVSPNEVQTAWRFIKGALGAWVASLFCCLTLSPQPSEPTGCYRPAHSCDQNPVPTLPSAWLNCIEIVYLDSQVYGKTSSPWFPTWNAGWVMAHLSMLQWLSRGAFDWNSPLWLISFIISIYVMHTVGVGSRYEYGNYFTKSFTETSLFPSPYSLAWHGCSDL